MTELEQKIEEFARKWATHHPNGKTVFRDDMNELLSLAKQEQAEADAKILERMTPEVPDDVNVGGSNAGQQ